MNARLLIALAAGVALVGFALRPDVRGTDDIDPQIFRANNERWQALPEAEREALRERFHRFRALPPGEQEAFEQRSATLRRLRAGLEVDQGREPTAEEAATALARRVDTMRSKLVQKDAAALSDSELLAQLDGRTRRCLSAFLDNLEKHGRVPSEELVRLRAQSLPEQVRDALLLLKHEQISLYAEGVRPDEADALLPLAPLDVAARTDRQRRDRGFLGKLSRFVPLSDNDRLQLNDAVSVMEYKERLRDMKAAELREVLSAHGLPPERIEAVLTGPVNELERVADEVLDSPTASVAPAVR